MKLTWSSKNLHDSVDTGIERLVWRKIDANKFNFPTGMMILSRTRVGSDMRSHIFPQAVELKRSDYAQHPHLNNKGISPDQSKVNLIKEFPNAKFQQGISFLEKPPLFGYLVSEIDKVGRLEVPKNIRLISPLDVEMQQLYEKSIYSSYKELGLENKHQDIVSTPLPYRAPDGQYSASIGLYAYSINASIDTNSEWRGMSDGGPCRPLHAFIDRSDSRELKGFVLFGKNNSKNSEREVYFVSQMGVSERGRNTGYNLMRSVIENIKSRTEKPATLYVFTRHGNEPAINLYRKKLNMTQMDAHKTKQVMGVSPDKYIGFSLEI